MLKIQISSLPKISWRFYICLFCGLCFFSSFYLRSYRLSQIHSFESDEHSWIMTGVSLIDKHIPVSWSMFQSSYTKKSKGIFNSRKYTLVEPFLDHPPLFSLLMGSWHKLTVKDYGNKMDWGIDRQPMVVFSMLTILFTSLLVLKLEGWSAGLITFFTYCAFPTSIISSRFITPENIIILFLFMTLYLHKKISVKPNKIIKVLICTLALLAPLFKLFGFVVPLSLLIMSLQEKNYYRCFALSLICIASGILLLSYAAFYDLEIFKIVMLHHHTRPQSAFHFWSIFYKLDIGFFPLKDPSIIFGMLGLASTLNLNSEKAKYYGSALIATSLLFSYVAPSEQYGWYKYLFQPLLAIGIAQIFILLLNGNLYYLAFIFPYFFCMLELSYPILDSRLSFSLVCISCLFLAICNNYFSKQIYQIACSVFLSALFFCEIVWTLAVLNRV